MSDPVVTYAAENGVARLTITSPARMNAMSFDMWRSIPDLVDRAVADDSVRVIALTGSGEKAFCAGADISQFGEKRSGADAVQAYEDAVTAGMGAIRDAIKPTVAVIRGICFGGGAAFALMCDIRIAASDARFRVPAARLGLGYAYRNIETMIHKIGVAATSELLLSARIVDATDALRMGIIQRMTPVETFGTDASDYLAAIATNAPLTLKAVKRALIELSRPTADRNVAAADAAVAACFASQDYIEGQAAFREKRTPTFTGR